MARLTDKDVLDVLIGARSRVEKGWAKHTLIDERRTGVAYCAVGAIASAAGISDKRLEDAETDRSSFRGAQKKMDAALYELMQGFSPATQKRYLQDEVADPWSSVPFVNDSVSSKKPILAAFDRAIANVRERVNA